MNTSRKKISLVIVLFLFSILSLFFAQSYFRGLEKDEPQTKKEITEENSGQGLAPICRFDDGVKMIATWYGGEKFHGKKTSSGEVFDENGHTAAHNHLPKNTLLCVQTLTNIGSTETVIVKITDKGGGELQRNKSRIDLSLGVAKALGFVEAGRVPVIVSVIKSEKQS